MKALFITTATNDCDNHVAAWDAAAGKPAHRSRFALEAIRNDWQHIERAEELRPDVMFYIGAHKGAGLPTISTFKRLREIAPLIHLVSDSGDRPWLAPLDAYRRERCFDLQAGIDGVPTALVDLATLTPVNPAAFEGPAPGRDIHCGFSGSPSGKRHHVLGGLGSKCLVRVRGNDYADHVAFLRRCRIMLNVSWMGSGKGHHVKGRCVEAGWAGCALLESVDSPLAHWFPPETYFRYSSVEDAAELLTTVSDEAVERKATALAALVRERFHPAMIYGEMLDKAGVVHTLARQATDRVE